MGAAFQQIFLKSNKGGAAKGNDALLVPFSPDLHAPRIHHQWLPDQIYYETRGLSPDTVKVLGEMGYKTTEQTPWGATEMIVMGLPNAAGVGPASSGNDSGVSGKVLPGFIYGANDARRPAGSAGGY